MSSNVSPDYIQLKEYFGPIKNFQKKCKTPYIRLRNARKHATHTHSHRNIVINLLLSKGINDGRHIWIRVFLVPSNHLVTKDCPQEGLEISLFSIEASLYRTPKPLRVHPWNTPSHPH